MDFVIPWPDARQMNLGALPATLPVLDTLVDLLLDFVVDQPFDIGKFNAALFSTVNLLPQIFVVLLRIGLGRIDPLLSNSGKSAPAKIVSKNLLRLGADAPPDRLQLLFGREEVKVSANNTGDLPGLAKGISERDGETVLRDVSNSSAGLAVSPNCPGRINPTGVGGIAILGNQLRGSFEWPVRLTDRMIGNLRFREVEAHHRWACGCW